MKETIKGLLQLRDIDDRLTHLKARIEDGPRILAKRNQEFKREQEALEQKRELLKSIKVDTKSKEVELKDREGEVKKQEGYLLAAKSNQEYNTLQDQIKRLNEEVGELEESILKSFDHIEGENQQLRAMEQELEIQKKDLEEFRKTIEKDITDYDAEIEEYKNKRAVLSEILSFEAVLLYEKVKNARGGAAIVSADGQTCGGCYMTITPNDIARLRDPKEMVLCKSCQRILYLTETIS